MDIGLIIFLLLLGNILILVELFFIPGTIVTGVLGLGTIIGACYLAYTIIGVNACIWMFVINVLLLAALTIVLLRTRTWKKLSLETKIESRIDQAPESKGLAVGMIGTAVTRLAPMGKVSFDGEIVEVTTSGEFINPSEEVTISRIEDNKIYVTILK